MGRANPIWGAQARPGGGGERQRLCARLGRRALPLPLCAGAAGPAHVGHTRLRARGGGGAVDGRHHGARNGVGAQPPQRAAPSCAYAQREGVSSPLCPRPRRGGGRTAAYLGEPARARGAVREVAQVLGAASVRQRSPLRADGRCRWRQLVRTGQAMPPALSPPHSRHSWTGTRRTSPRQARTQGRTSVGIASPLRARQVSARGLGTPRARASEHPSPARRRCLLHNGEVEVLVATAVEGWPLLGPQVHFLAHFLPALPRLPRFPVFLQALAHPTLAPRVLLLRALQPGSAQGCRREREGVVRQTPVPLPRRPPPREGRARADLRVRRQRRCSSSSTLSSLGYWPPYCVAKA